MSKNEVKPEGPQSTWRIRFLCWISKATRPQAHTHTRALTPTSTHTHSQEFTDPCVQARTHARTQICNTYCFSTATVFSSTHFSVTLYVDCVSYLSLCLVCCCSLSCFVTNFRNPLLISVRVASWNNTRLTFLCICNIDIEHFSLNCIQLSISFNIRT